jgi:hypothetical protein
MTPASPAPVSFVPKLPPGDYALRFGGYGRGTAPFAVPGWNYRGETPLTIELWLTPANQRFELACGHTKAGPGIVLVLQTDGTWNFHYYLERNGGNFGIKSDKPAEVGRRTHIALTYDQYDMKLFVDGVEQARSVSPTISKFAPTEPFHIGAAWENGKATNPITGVIDEVRISRVVRYKKNFTPAARHEPDADTELLYHFDEGEGNEVRDASPHARHARPDRCHWVKPDGTPITP